MCGSEIQSSEPKDANVRCRAEGNCEAGVCNYEQHFSHYIALFLSHLIHSYKGSLETFRPLSFSTGRSPFLSCFYVGYMAMTTHRSADAQIVVMQKDIQQCTDIGREEDICNLSNMGINNIGFKILII